MCVCVSVPPVVQEYLKTYRGVHNFKDAISRLLEDKGLSVCLSVCLSLSVCVCVSVPPVVQEYLKTYRGVHNFKDAISRLLEDKGMSVCLSVCLSVCTPGTTNYGQFQYLNGIYSIEHKIGCLM